MAAGLYADGAAAARLLPGAVFNLHRDGTRRGLGVPLRAGTSVWRLRVVQRRPASRVAAATEGCAGLASPLPRGTHSVGGPAGELHT